MNNLWKITCQEDKFPGMWQRWFKNQCVAVGWAAEFGHKLNGKTIGGRGWSTARNALKEMQIGEYVVVALKNRRIGRIGQITNKFIEDNYWNPLVPVAKEHPIGEMGRRVEVRWDLTVGPDSQDLVVKMPDNSFTSGELRPTISRIRSISLEDLKTEMDNPVNWVSLLGKFSYESTLSDYIANYSYHLEEGLLPHPHAKIRERVFKEYRPVIVECKQHSPVIDDISQLRHYMNLYYEETGDIPRGIIVHGGPQKISKEIAEATCEDPVVEIVSYMLDIRFRPSSFSG